MSESKSVGSWFDRFSKSPSREEKKKKKSLDSLPEWKKVDIKDIAIGVYGEDRAGSTTLVRALAQKGRSTSESGDGFRVDMTDSKTTRLAEFIKLPGSSVSGQQAWIVDLCDLTDKDTLKRLNVIIYIVGTGCKHPNEAAVNTSRDLFTNYRGKALFVHSQYDEFERVFSTRKLEERAKWKKNYSDKLGNCPIEKKMYWTAAKNFDIGDTEDIYVNQDVLDLRRTLLDLCVAEEQSKPATMGEKLALGGAIGATAMATIPILDMINPELVHEVTDPLIHGVSTVATVVMELLH